MVRLLLSRLIRHISMHAFYSLWIRASGVTFVLWAAFSATDSWIAETSLTFILILLLIGGIFLVVLGIRDLIRDFRHFLHARSDKDGHASV